jgi:hypothetical protein
MGRTTRTITRLTIAGLSLLTTLAISAASAHEVVAQVIGKTN